MNRRQLVLSLLLVGTPATAVAQPPPIYVDRYDTSLEGEAVGSVDVFYDQLSPYGVWVDEPRFGLVFLPDLPRFVPYTEGHWQYTNIGFVWISIEPFAWATSHYGRWAYSPTYRRWVWRPDTVWGPSWVEWRQFGDYFGWAPLAPDISIQIGYAPPIESWHFCGAAHLFDANVSRYYEPPHRVTELHRGSGPIQHYANVGGARVVVGPPAAVLREHHINVRPTAIDVRAAGRWTPAESRAAIQRAQQRRPTIEELNRKRIESNAAVRETQVRVRQESKQPPQVRQQSKQQPKQPPQVRKEPKQPPQVRKEPKQPPQVRKEPKRMDRDEKPKHN
ncbi:MAG: hypothetical protein H6Q90_3042 [Deltaproteobacteria bacterium]|nr:hypothetical protein [Deltaproteobacteria bacterium]